MNIKDWETGNWVMICNPNDWELVNLLAYTAIFRIVGESREYKFSMMDARRAGILRPEHFRLPEIDERDDHDDEQDIISGGV